MNPPEPKASTGTLTLRAGAEWVLPDAWTWMASGSSSRQSVGRLAALGARRELDSPHRHLELDVPVRAQCVLIQVAN